MAALTDPSIAGAIRLLMAESIERRKQAQEAVDLADQAHTVISSLHDLLIECESRAGQPLHTATWTCTHHESRWGRCTACGKSWEQQAQERSA